MTTHDDDWPHATLDDAVSQLSDIHLTLSGMSEVNSIGFDAIERQLSKLDKTLGEVARTVEALSARSRASALEGVMDRLESLAKDVRAGTNILSANLGALAVPNRGMLTDWLKVLLLGLIAYRVW
jgi:hypothetical protein